MSVSVVGNALVVGGDYVPPTLLDVPSQQLLTFLVAWCGPCCMVDLQPDKSCKTASGRLRGSRTGKYPQPPLSKEREERDALMY
jgi:hypothetical protein